MFCVLFYHLSIGTNTSMACDFCPVVSNFQLFCHHIFSVVKLGLSKQPGNSEGKCTANGSGASPRAQSRAFPSEELRHVIHRCRSSVTAAGLTECPRLPTAVGRCGGPADPSRPAALQQVLGGRGGLHLPQLLQQRANRRAENSARSARRAVLSADPGAVLEDRFVPVEPAPAPQRRHPRVRDGSGGRTSRSEARAHGAAPLRPSRWCLLSKHYGKTDKSLDLSHHVPCQVFKSQNQLDRKANDQIVFKKER